MNILLISSYLPYPLTSGGHVRLYNLIKGISRKYNITLICEKRDYQGELEIKEIERFCKKVIAIPRRKQWTLKNVLKTGLSLSSFLITGHKSVEMQKEIKRELNEGQFGLIHAETSYIMQNLPPTDIPLVLIEHNIEYLVYKRYADNASLLLRPFLYLDILKLKYWEEKMWKKATKLVAVSEIEKEIMSKIRKDVMVVSNGVDTLKFKATSDPSASLRARKRKAENGEKRILFIGDFRWVQNRNAIAWILKEIWPKLQSEFIPLMSDKGIKLWIVGRKIPESIKRLAKDKSIIFDENAPKETELIYQKADLLIAPIRVGGGTSFKVLEAMASGLPVITTDLGNAIGAKDNLEILIADTAEEFVAKIKQILEDKDFYEKISKNARKLVEEKFSWGKIIQDLNSVYESVVPYA